MSIELTLNKVEGLIPNLETVGIDNKVVAYRFNGGVYKGVTFTYVNIRFNVVDVENGNALTEYKPEDVDTSDPDGRYALEVAFEYVILENINERDMDTKHFKEYIGAVLVKIVESSVSDAPRI